jgi:ring-1,2-phenylacetyl-CoA epoxidase subunit PaaE
MMTTEAQDVALFHGRLDAEKLETMVTKGLIRPEDCDAIFICGPQGMIENLSEKLVEIGVDESRIKYELFTPSTPIKPKTKRKKTEGKRKKTEVRIIIEGGERTIWMDEDDLLIDVAAQAGVDLPYSCESGMCSTCRCHLAEGEGRMRQNFSLEPWETAAGYVLGCQFTPKSKSVTLDFDTP